MDYKDTNTIRNFFGNDLTEGTFGKHGSKREGTNEKRKEKKKKLLTLTSKGKKSKIESVVNELPEKTGGNGVIEGGWGDIQEYCNRKRRGRKYYQRSN